MKRAAGPRGVHMLAFAVLLACGTASSCIIASGTLAPRASTPAESVTDAVLADVVRDVIAEVNRTRSSNSVNGLARDSVLDRVAREHSIELAQRGELDHTSTDPARRTVTMRIEGAGIAWAGLAENLAGTWGPRPDVPATVVRMWLGSSGHRRNMLSPDYTHTGVGVAVDRRGMWYVTQLYLLPR